VEFRELPEGRSVQRPNIDLDELTDAGTVLRGDVEVVGERVGGEHKGELAEGSIAQSLLDVADLSETKFRTLTLDDVVCHGADLSNALWDRISARRVELLNCRAVGWRVQFDQLTDVYLGDCRLDYAVINIERVKGLAVFERCSFRQATIAGNLSNTVFLDCDFDGAQFAARGAKGCDLRTSALLGAHGMQSLAGATISPDQAVAIARVLAAEAGLVVSD